MEKRVYNPTLPFVKRGYKGNLLKGGRFTNAPWPDTNASFFKVIQWFFTPNPQKQEKTQDNYRPEVIHDEHLFQAKDDLICWLGHATFFIRLEGVNLLIDPIVGDIPFVKRLVPFPVSPDTISGLDYILLSHAHRDHFDVPSLKKVLPQNPNASVLGPLKIGRLLKQSGFENHIVQEAGWYQQFITERIRISFLLALHWNKRGMSDFNTILWGSFLIESDKCKIFFAGDTAYGSHFKEIKDTMGKPDICLMPIGAYQPPFIMKQSHTNPEEAIQAFEDMEGRYFIPMHYGTYDLADEPVGEPIRRVRKNLGTESLKALQPGEKFLLSKIRK